MTEREIAERVRRLKGILASQTRGIDRQQADRVETMRELRAYRVPLREIGDLAGVAHQTVANWIGKARP